MRPPNDRERGNPSLLELKKRSKKEEEKKKTRAWRLCISIASKGTRLQLHDSRDGSGTVSTRESICGRAMPSYFLPRLPPSRSEKGKGGRREREVVTRTCQKDDYCDDDSRANSNHREEEGGMTQGGVPCTLRVDC